MVRGTFPEDSPVANPGVGAIAGEDCAPLRRNPHFPQNVLFALMPFPHLGQADSPAAAIGAATGAAMLGRRGADAAGNGATAVCGRLTGAGVASAAGTFASAIAANFEPVATATGGAVLAVPIEALGIATGAGAGALTAGAAARSSFAPHPRQNL